MTRLTELLETPERFRAWLEGKPASATVGYAGAVSYCPLARYLMESMTRRGLEARVYPGSTKGDVMPWVSYGRKGKGQPLPPWAATVAQQVDSKRKGDGTTVTAAEALAILADVEGNHDRE